MHCTFMPPLFGQQIVPTAHLFTHVAHAVMLQYWFPHGITPQHAITFGGFTVQPMAESIGESGGPASFAPSIAASSTLPSGSVPSKSMN